MQSRLHWHAFRAALLLLVFTNSNHSVFSQDKGFQLLPDSSNFVKASLLEVAPASDIYSVFGHSAVRMECPMHHLDYTFSFESDPSVGGFITFFAGKAKAFFVAVPTEEFLEVQEREGRSITQRELLLTLHEKQELWRLLDNDMLEGPHRKFNLLLSNCVSTTVAKIKECCIGEHLEWGPWEDRMLLNNGDLVRYNARRSAWAEFLFVTFLGTGYDDYYDQETRLCPENLEQVLSKASFKNDSTGIRRPVISDKEETLLSVAEKPAAATPSPTMVFGLLLLFVVMVTIAERWHKAAGLARCTDVVLFVTQSVIGLLLMYVTLVSEIFGLLWNWYLIPFNPVPLLLWLVLRKRKDFGKVYLVYTVVLVGFMLLTPLISQLDIPHQLITAAMAVRCGSKYMDYRQKRN